MTPEGDGVLTQFMILLRQIGVFAMSLILGFCARKFKLLSKGECDSLAAFCIRFLLPLYLATTCIDAGTVLTTAKVFILFGTFIVLHLLMHCTAFITRRVFKWTGKQADIDMVIETTTNAGFIGIPMGDALYGTYGSIFMAFYSLFDTLLMFTHKTFVLRKYEPDSSVKAWKRIINPQTVSILIGVILAIIGLNLKGNLVWDTLASVGSMTKYVALIYLGTTICDVSRESLAFIKPLCFTIVLRLLIFPVVIGLLSRLVGFGETDVFLITVLVATPPATSTPALVRSFNIESKYIQQVVIIMITVSVVTIPAVMWLVLNIL